MMQCWKMAPVEQYVIFILLVFMSLQNYNSASPSIACVCMLNESFCENCTYNITLIENGKIYEEYNIICDKDNNSSLWMGKHLNETHSQIDVCQRDCNSTSVYFNFSLLQTVSIYIRNSNLIEIKVDVNPRNLKLIDLSSNKLQCITKGLFNNYFNLRKLILHNNEITNIMAETFEGLNKLESLDLSENNLTVLTNVFTPLKSLQHLNLSRNNIEFINENYFNNWLLQHLDVSHNNLKKVAPGALQLLPNLARLLLTDNPHLGITQLDTQLLVGTGRRLQQIDASRTGLYQVPEAFTHSVRFLSLVGNRISSVGCGDLDSYPLLQSLDFSDNKIISVEDDSLGRLEMLLFININKNLLTVVPKSLPDELKYLSINNNFIQNLTITDLKNLPNLRILLLQCNSIHYIQEHVFDDLLSLEMLDLSNNPLQLLSPNTFDGPLSLRDLRLCYLNLSVPEGDGAFPISSPESIQMLHLQSSPGLARQLLGDSAALAAFTHLQYLDLRMNNISEIRSDLLFYLVQLKTLRLHGNGINCSAQLWLKDWMNWNNSHYNEESCYFASLEAKDDVIKYNCTFPETFTISESLPPVNLYSTEMINKLLRYYGYLNKTERSLKHHNISNAISDRDENITNVKFAKNSILPPEQITMNYHSSAVALDSSDSKNEIKVSINDYINESAQVKIRETTRILDQSKDNQIIDHRFLDLEPNLSLPNRNSKKIFYAELHDILRKNKTGKRLNTPVNITKKINIDSAKDASKVHMQFGLKINKTDSDENEHRMIVDSNEKSEYSPYQSAHKTYIQYLGTIAVCSLILISLILWASFRLRYRRRRIPVAQTETEDQIEVSNISGGVLW